MVQLGHSGQVDAVAMSAAGQVVLTAGDKTARLWEAQTGKEIRSFEGHSNYVGSAVFSPVEQVILTAGSDNTVRLWDTATGKEIENLKTRCLALRPRLFPRTAR